MSLFTKQYTISEASYDFWDAIRKQNANSGSLYNTQPHQIRGNVINVNDKSESVLGFFEVASVTESRIFVDKPTDPDIELSGCIIDPMALPRALGLGPEYWPVYLTEENGALGVTGVLAEDGCLDCREVGGTIVQPDFWID